MSDQTIDLAYLRKIKAIVRLQGREYLTHPGLLRVAAEHGLSGISTEVVHADFEGGEFYMRATVSGSRGSFTGHGDAAPRNVGKMIVPHAFRMAETRAVGRALRYYLGVGMTLQEELVGGGPPALPPHPAPSPLTLTAPPNLENWLGALAVAVGVPAAQVDAYLSTRGADGWKWREATPAARERARGRLLGDGRADLADWLRENYGAQVPA